RALITGSGRGIGFLMAKGLAEAGAEVIINATQQVGAQSAAEKLRALGHTAHAVAFDVTDSHQVHQAIDDIEAKIGPIDILINNAGIQRRRHALDET
uniref:SDR family NAD(P)-dependent oxidoreductase n=1 Tax=Rosenbergiella nectarea TaxID=988801 RepID=UPI001F4FFA06